MEITKNDFQSWLANPVTREIRRWAEEQQDALVEELAEQIADGAVIPEEHQREVIRQSTGYSFIHQLEYEDINDSEDTTDGDEQERDQAG